MDHTLRVRLLGRVAAWRGAAELDLGPGRQRAVFAVLAMRANQVVSREALIDAVWGESTPAGASNNLYSYVSRLRLALGRSTQTLISAGSGYSLRLDPDSLDVRAFDQLREVAQQCWNRRDIAGARAALDEALALWHGDALDGVDSPFATLHRKRLTDLRLAALERRTETMIAASDPDALPELRRLVREYPFRETLLGLLMTALHREGRDAEAVEAFDAARRTLVGRLGIEPGPALRRIHAEIIAQPQVQARAVARPAGPDVLVGREHELALLRTRLASLRRGIGGVVWIEGGPGVGKSALLASGLAGFDGQVLWAPGDAETGRLSWPSAASGWPGIDQFAGFIEEMAPPAPVVLVVDDMQWVDTANLLVWHRLGKLARQTPLLLVGACRPVPRRTELDRVRSAVVSSAGDVVQLAGLSYSAVVELTTRLLGTAPDQRLLSIVDCAAGNPRFLRELVEVADDPPALESVVATRLTTLTGATQEVLRWAAALGTEFDLGDLATIMHRPATALIPAVEEATAAGVLREAGHLFAFRHPLLRRVLTPEP
ncbi:MAG: BTAD domain-containing putative transcriptional regulator [Kibdelosporangium sp.]